MCLNKVVEVVHLVCQGQGLLSLKVEPGLRSNCKNTEVTALLFYANVRQSWESNPQLCQWAYQQEVTGSISAVDGLYTMCSL